MLLTAVLLALTWICPQDQFPEPRKSNEPIATMETLDRLVEQYKGHHLPIPPPEAQLVRLSGASLGENNEVLSFQVGYRLGEPNKSGARRTLIGTSWIWYRYDDNGLVEPVAANASKVMISDGAGLALAIIERTRGHSEFALQVLRRCQKEPSYHRSRIEEANPNLDEQVRDLALQHWIAEIKNPESDRSLVAGELERLTTMFPKLGTEDVMKTLRRLKLTVTNRYAGDDPYERLVDDLCDAVVEGTALSSPDPSKALTFVPLLNIVDNGYAIVPTLIRHVTDERLSRAESPAFMNGEARSITVGDICAAILDQFRGTRGGWYPDPAKTQKEFQEWWAVSAKSSEREWCRKSLLKSSSFPSEVQLRVAQKRYPDILPGVYRALLADSAGVYTHTVLAAMEASQLPRNLIVECALLGAAQSNLDQVHAALWTLKRLDTAAFNQELKKTLQKLGTSGTGTAWTSRESSFAQQVANSTSPEVWKALLEATKRADVDLRLELIQHASYGNSSPAGVRCYLSYLLAFFDDPAVPPPHLPKEDSRFDGTHDHFGLHTTRVQDLAASLAAEELDIDAIPAAAATREQWDTFRAGVKQAIELFLK